MDLRCRWSRKILLPEQQSLHTLRTGDDFFFRNNGDQTFSSWDDGGRVHFHEPSSNSTQSTYRMQVTGDNGLNINASEGLSSGQKSTVKTGGDKQYIDSYGIFKRNRQTISETSPFIK